MNKEKLLSEISRLNIQLTKLQIKHIEEFCVFLLQENKKYNLTAIKNIEEVYLKHVYDSLTLVNIVDFSNYHTLLDIGSGGGFPGIILKIVFPHLKITLLDSNNKKTSFLEKVKSNFALKDLTVVCSRAEEYIQSRREFFDLVTARAVANLSIICELAIPYLKVNGFFLAMKGNDKEELCTAKVISKALNSQVYSIKEFSLPIENSKRTLISIQKNAPTPFKYPRRYSIILKNPL